jgi:NADP-dependent 3-hydroxy acid dehydrogenase YdfG
LDWPARRAVRLSLRPGGDDHGQGWLMDKLSGAVALVTGAGGGIGRAITRALVDAGATTWLVGRTAERLEKTARACGGKHVRVRPADLTKDAETEALSRELEREHGRLDVLVHCAGALVHGTIEETGADSLGLQFEVNVRSFYVLVQKLLPLLRAGPGQIVVVNSSIVSAARAGTGQYAATKHALLALTDTLRHEVNADGIRVLSVFPGRTATPLQERVFAQEGRSYEADLLLQPEDLATMVVTALQLPRTAEVTEIHIRPMLKTY